jgi:hypothetical protein
VFVAQNDETLIHVFDRRSGRNFTFPHRLTAIPVTASSWEAAKAELIASLPLARTRKLASDVLAEATRPDRQPAFIDMKADRAGRLWVRLPASSPLTPWRIYDTDGKFVASMSLPSAMQPLDIDETRIVALERDSLDVQRIVVHTFPRPFLPAAATRARQDAMPSQPRSGRRVVRSRRAGSCAGNGGSRVA